MLDISVCYINGGLGSRGQKEHERWRFDESVLGGKTAHVSGGW